MATIKRLQTLFSKYGIDTQQRHEIIYSWTGGRTSSSKGLLCFELDELCAKLESDYRYRTNVDAYTELEKKRKRSIVIKIAQEIGIHNPKNWNSLNNFMLNRSILKKVLPAYTLEELDPLIRQFQSMKQNYKNSSYKPYTKAYWNERGLPNIEKN